MKKLLLFLTLVPAIYLAQYTAIPDQNFEQALIDLGHDDVIDGQLLTANISSVDSLDVSGYFDTTTGQLISPINDLTGIEDQ